MAEIPEHHVRETKTLKFARFIVRHRHWVSSFLILTTLFFLYPTINAISTAFGAITICRYACCYWVCR